MLRFTQKRVLRHSTGFQVKPTFELGALRLAVRLRWLPASPSSRALSPARPHCARGAVLSSRDCSPRGFLLRFESFVDLVQFAMDQFQALIEPGRQFARDSIRLVKRCTKPDRKEYQKIAVATAIGFAIMGFIGFFVKLIHIPINNIIVGA
ncbi:protein translocase SEC61 complex gamma subunit, and eukaryotic [Ancylostoma duodenale]|nr:protein translocase SEC61 complex gamma subunit, and eukaryotic [Ancylostoma duodenale]